MFKNNTVCAVRYSSDFIAQCVLGKFCLIIKKYIYICEMIHRHRLIIDNHFPENEK